MNRKAPGYLAAAGLLFLVACGDQTRSGRKDNGAAAEGLAGGFKAVAAATRDDTPQEKQEIQKKIEGQIAEFGDRLNELKEKAEKTAGKVKAELNEAIKDSEKKMAAAKRQLKRLKSASAQAWEDAKSRMKVAMDDLKQAYDRAVDRFKKSA